jgi:predicted DNA-binding transcriptional regulator AlpA
MEKLLNPKDMAGIFNVKTGTLYSWMSRGVDLPPGIKISGSTRWREEVVKKWIEAKEKERRKRNFED